jgi:hypothetical protein
LGEIDHALGGFLRGQCTIALILATIYAVGLALLGVPLGALLGIISGLANLVPYMSIVAGLVPTLVLFLLSDAPSMGGVLGIILLFVGGQLLEGVYLSPPHGPGNGVTSRCRDGRDSGWWDALWLAGHHHRGSCHGCAASRPTSLAPGVAGHLATFYLA